MGKQTTQQIIDARRAQNNDAAWRRALHEHGHVYNTAGHQLRTLLIAARAHGMSVAEIGRETGLTRAHVHHVLRCETW